MSEALPSAINTGGVMSGSKPISGGSDWILENFQSFERTINGQSETPFHTVRRTALEAYKTLGFPNSAQEAWKYTDPRPIWEGQFKNVKKNEALGGELAEADPVHLTSRITGVDSYQFVFVDGQLLTSSTIFSAGVMIASLADAQKLSHPAYENLSQHFGTIANCDESFLAINTAFVTDGLVLFLEKNAALDKPVEVIFISTENAEGAALYPRILCVLDQGASATVIERYISEGPSAVYFSNAVLECKVGENAHLTHYRVQEESESAFHVSTIQGSVESNSSFRTNTFSFGGKLVRNHVNIVMNGSNADVAMNGLSVLGDSQHVDNTTLLDHAQPRCESFELYKGIYGDKSQGVFSGTIIVREDAQKTNAIQSNRSILLSNEAQVNTKPQLKIWADDVKCTHGATIGQLNDEALFYIETRGVGKKEAKVMLVHAFASEVISEVKLPELHDELVEKLQLKLARISG